MRRAWHLLLIFGLTLPGMAHAGAQSLKHCFTDTGLDGWWRAAGDKALYIRANGTRYYRLDLVQSCGFSQFPGAHIILHVHGSDTICSPLDFDLRVSQGVGDIAQPCFVSKMSEASPSEIAALMSRKP